VKEDETGGKGGLCWRLGGTGAKLEDIIKAELAEIEWEGVKWIYVAQGLDKWELL